MYSKYIVIFERILNSDNIDINLFKYISILSDIKNNQYIRDYCIEMLLKKKIDKIEEILYWIKNEI